MNYIKNCFYDDGDNKSTKNPLGLQDKGAATEMGRPEITVGDF